MRLVGIAMVKNEADVIEAFVRHNLAYLDILAIIDNDSSDGTREILLALQREGLPVIVFDDPIFGYFQSEKTTYVFRKVIKAMVPDHVFFLDADEFLNVPSRAALEASLGAIRPGTVGQMPWRTYVPAPEAGSARITDPPRQIRHRRVAETPTFYKIVLSLDNIDCGKVVLAQGNHSAILGTAVVPQVDLPGVKLAHFPVRSAEQVTRKAIMGWLAYIKRNQTKNVPGEGFQWQSLYERAVESGGLPANEVTAEALRYAQAEGPARVWPTDVIEDPVAPRHEELQYGSLARTGVLSTVVQSFARVLDPNPRLRFNLGPAGSAAAAEPTAPAASTAFTASWHTENLYLDLPPFRHLAEKFEPKSVLDLGCGVGGYLKLFAENGASPVMGVDGFPANGKFLAPGRYLQHDLGSPLEIGTKFDLVMCMEVIEHIDAAHEDVLIDSICRHAKEGIIFSAAEVNQPGLGHINCRPIEHWLAKFAARGWSPLLFDTLAMRALATFSWFRRNSVVLVRGDAPDDGAPDELARHGRVPFAWPNQDPTIVRHPLWELVAH